MWVASSNEESLKEETLLRLYLKIREIWRLQGLGYIFARIISFWLYMYKEPAKIIKKGKKFLQSSKYMDP